ncbi:MAG: glycosyltransferase family 2 protein [Rhodospirillales bacterium]
MTAEAARESARAPGKPALSVVVPMRNEAQGVDAFMRRLLPALDRRGLGYDGLCVDDGSADATWDALLAWRERAPAVRLLALSRNFGKEVALTAGLDAARGEAVVLIDADLQHPPELIERFVAKWRAGFDMVYAQRRGRENESWLRRNAARAFYRVFQLLADVEIPDGAGDFRLLDRKVVDALKAMPERARFMKGLYAWVGFRHAGVPFDPDPRVSGRSAWRLGRLLRFAADGLVSFSTKPLTAAAWLGAALAATALAMGLYFLFRTLILGVDLPGYASLIVAVMVLGGVQLFCLGLFGAYLGRLYEEVKRRPLYILSRAEGFEAEAADAPGTLPPLWVAAFGKQAANDPPAEQAREPQRAPGRRRGAAE